MITVAEMLALSIFDGYELLAGAGGLSRGIRCVDYLEVPESDTCVTADIFLFSTTYALQRHTRSIADLIRVYDSQRSSGLGVKLGWYLDEIPAEALARADELRFPIVKLPMDLSYVDITRVVMAKILDSESAVHAVNTVADLFKQILFGGRPESAFERLENSGWPRTAAVCAAYSTAEAGEGRFTALMAELDGVLLDYDRAKIGVFRAPLPEGFFSELDTEWGENFGCFMGLSRSRPLRSLGTSLNEAKCAYELAAALGHTNGVFEGENMGPLLELAVDLQGREFAEKAAHFLFPLVKAGEESGVDLTETLRTWLALDRSTEATARALFIHRNTLRHRLKKIDELIPLTADNVLMLRLALVSNWFMK